MQENTIFLEKVIPKYSELQTIARNLATLYKYMDEDDGCTFNREEFVNFLAERLHILMGTAMDQYVNLVAGREYF